MNGLTMFPSKETIEQIRRENPEGTRVVAVRFGVCQCGKPSHDDNLSVPQGTEGTVRDVDDAGTVHVSWDNGRSIGLIPNVDTWEKKPMEAETEPTEEVFYTGDVTVRFEVAHPMTYLEDFASRHSLKVLRVNEFIEAQAVFRPNDEGEELTEVIRKILATDKDVAQVWPNTISKYERVNPSAG